jgi:hypothetical protein
MRRRAMAGCYEMKCCSLPGPGTLGMLPSPWIRALHNNRLDHCVKTMLHTDWLRRENRFRFNDFVHGRSLMK